MKLLSWNIQQGGGRRQTQIEAAIRDHDPDVVVLGEYLPGRSDPLLSRLSDLWRFQALTAPPARYGGLAILSRFELEPIGLTGPLAPFGYRVLPVGIPSEDVVVVGIYGPLHKDPFDEYWNALLDNLGESRGRPTIVVGDFNTGAPLLDGPGGPFFCSQYFGKLREAGYRDLWRAEHGVDRREHTWMGSVNPYRLDHAFGSEGLEGRMLSCRYDHVVREKRVSDHSALVVELVSKVNDAA